MKIILGSASKQRKNILERNGYSFEVMPSDINEKTIRKEDPKELTMALAMAKAEALLAKIQEPVLLVTADQVVYCNGQILEKPEDAKAARRFLEGYAKHPAEVINATVVTNMQNGKQAGENDVSTVYFRPFSEEVISKLIEEGNIFSQAGAFSVEDRLVAPFVERVEGSVDSVEGLSIELMERLIKEVA